jgi:ABC-2 type transport system ATP-binding protein
VENNAAVETKSLTKRYGRTVAVRDLSLSVKRGEVYGLLGPNGAGKTTTIRLLLGLIRPTSGSACIFGHDSWRDGLRARRHVAYVPSELSLWPQLTGAQTLEMLGRLHGSWDDAYKAELIERFQLDPAKKVRSYSSGNKQKVGLIAAFMSRADVLILDEPTLGLDPLVVQVYRECIREASSRGQTVLVSSHLLSEVEAVCHRVGLLREGQLIDEGSLDSLRHIAARKVRVVFGDKATDKATDISRIAGIRDLVVNGNVVECLMTGPIQPLLEVLARSDVKDFVCTEPSLEEIFLAHYGRNTPAFPS